MSKLEELEQQIEQNELNIGTIILKTAHIKKQIDEMKAEKEKPEYPDGMLGFSFSGGEGDRKHLVFYRGKNRSIMVPYLVSNTPDGRILSCPSFEPLTEAILPMAVEYDVGEYPGNPDDEIRIEFSDGTFMTRLAKEFTWHSDSKCINPKKRYWLIKKA